jgi:hypothetical protein
VQGAINRMIVGTVVMGVEARHSPLDETTLRPRIISRHGPRE